MQFDVVTGAVERNTVSGWRGRVPTSDDEKNGSDRPDPACIDCLEAGRNIVRPTTALVLMTRNDGSCVQERTRRTFGSVPSSIDVVRARPESVRPNLN